MCVFLHTKKVKGIYAITGGKEPAVPQPSKNSTPLEAVRFEIQLSTDTLHQLCDARDEMRELSHVSESRDYIRVKNQIRAEFGRYNKSIVEFHGLLKGVTAEEKVFFVNIFFPVDY